MIDTAVKSSAGRKNSALNVSESFHTLPEWEIIDSYALAKSSFFFFRKTLNMQLLKKFSEKAGIEKYLLRSDIGRNISAMDLRVYKDCVYIVNLEIYSADSALEAVKILLKTAEKKACSNNNSALDLFISLPLGQKYRGTIKKALLSFGFSASENQGANEMKIFGETYMLAANHNDKANIKTDLK